MLQYIVANKTVPSRLINTPSEPLLSGLHIGFLVMSFLPLFSFSFFDVSLKGQESTLVIWRFHQQSQLNDEKTRKRYGKGVRKTSR